MTRRILLPTLTILLLTGMGIGFVPLRENNGTIVKWDLDTPGQPNVVNGRVTFYLDPAGTVDVPTAHNEAVAVRKAFATWEGVETSRIAFLEDESRPAFAQNSTDRVNLILWKGRWLPPGVLALTFPYSQNGIMTDVDIVLNDDFDWDTSEVGREFTADVQAVLTHEIGHMIGLDHVPLGCSTMHHELPLGAIRMRTLDDDDVSGITTLYPEPSAANLGAIRGRVTSPGKGDGRGVLIVAMDLETRIPASSAVTTAGGHYVMAGMKPGFYRLYSFPLFGTAGMVPYWKETNTARLGQIHGSTGIGPDRAKRVQVVYGSTTFGADFDNMRLQETANEPNDRPAEAILMEVEDSVIGLAARVGDLDWYRFRGRKGDRLAVHVDAWHVGADTNVQVDLYEAGMVDTDGVILVDGMEPPHPRVVDIRPPIFEENRTSLEGVDTDAWLTDVELEKDGYHFIRVSISPNSNTGTPLNYYLLTLYRDHRAPDDRTSEVTAHPAAVPAIASISTKIRIVPRNLAGDVLQNGIEITVTGEGLGEIGPVEDIGNGVFEAAVAAPDSPGRETFTVLIESPAGSVEIPTAVTIDYLGPPDPLRSRFEAQPARIEADGTAVTKVSLRMRDAQGREYGAGLPVEFGFADAPDGQLGDTRDEGDGEYTAELRAPTATGTDEVIAALAGESLGIKARVHYGFGLRSVVDGALATVGDLQSISGLGKGVMRKLARTEGRLLKARDLLATGAPADEAKALKLMRKALLPYRKVRAKLDNAGPDLTFDFAESARRFAENVLGMIVVTPGDKKAARRFSKAETIYNSAKQHIQSGIHDKALKELAKALAYVS